MSRCVRSCLASCATLVVAALAAPAAAQTAALKAPVGVAPNVAKLSPALSSSAILSRPDTDLVEMPDGRRMRVGDLRRLSVHAQKLQARAGALRSPALTARPAASGARVASAADLAAALKRAGGETVVLPSGRRATVGQLRFVQPYVEKKTGRSLTAAATQRPNLAGPAIKVTKQSDFKDVLQRPDPTILEAPDGTRITVGELKQSLARSDAPRR